MKTVYAIFAILMILGTDGCLRYQKNEAGTLKRPPPKNELDMKFVFVESGAFQIGGKFHKCRVTISKPFWIGKYEVTQKEYKTLIGNNPSYFKGDSSPVEVNWNDAVKFCEKLTASERKAGRLPSGYEYRLPTEAEWEYAARGGSESKGYKYSGSDDIDSVAWYWKNSGDSPLSGSWNFDKIKKNKCKSHSVGRKKANELGIHDMSGNVSEWCSDKCHDSYIGAPTDGSSWDSGSSSARVFRGGGWSYTGGYCISVVRSGGPPSLTGGILGFRVCLGRSF